MASLTAEDWTRSAARRLATHGVEEVRVEALAAQLGVSKGSFYWHFTNRDALLAAVLDHWEAAGTKAIIETVNADAAAPEARLEFLLSRVFGVQGLEPGIELGIRAWARTDERARAVTQRVDEQRMTYVAELVAGCGVPATTARLRADLVYRTLIGEFAMLAQGQPRLEPEARAELLIALLAGVR